MKKIIAVILTLAVCLVAFCVPASAASYKVKVYPYYMSGYTNVGLKTYNTTVYYTTDGSKPDRTDEKYTSLFRVTEPCTLRMAVYKGGKVVKRLSAKIKVEVSAPVISFEANSKGKYTATITVPENSKVYYTTNGAAPTKKSKKLTETKGITVEPGTEIRAFAVRSGWKNSSITSKKAPKKVPEVVVEEAPAPEPTKEELFLQKLLELINNERKRYYFDALTAEAPINAVAQIRAEELAESFSHCRPDGKFFTTALVENGVLYSGIGENIAKDFETAEEVFEYWRSSGETNKNFINRDFNRIGFGYAESEDGSENYWTIIFIKKPFESRVY